ncbi:unnamed protein product [Meganyctiphanes norvegica]|uniref:C2H2-type domain-containing protein n=1 Tax=Meganyctiphanes norvegica TaxID=48144 RepID=A0AAV2Q3M6_MEGNR
MCSHYNQKHPSEKLQWKEVFLDIEEPHQLVKDIEPYLLQVKIKYGIRKPNKENNQLRQYQCPYCNYTCNFNSSYNRHLRIHAGKKPYKCGYCNFHAREPYVIRKHSKIKHLNEEVKIEKDIYYNVPYRYSNESKIKSTINTKIKLKNQNKQKSKKVSEKVDNSNLDMELVSNSFALKNSTVINQIKPSLISKYKLHMKENEFEKDQDYNNYEANKDLKDSYMHSEVAIESKETKVATSNKEIVYSKNTILNNFTNFTSNDLQNTQLKLRYDSVEKTINMDSPLLKVSENIKGSHQNSVNASKSKSEFIFENDAKSLMLIQCPLSSDKQKLCQETSNVNKNLSKVDGIDANLTKKSEDNCLNLKKFYQQQDEAVSKRHSIILCEDNDFNNKTVVIRLCSVNLEEITGDNFKTKLSESIRIDNIKEMYETLSANGDISVDTYDVAINSSHEISQCESFLSLKQRNQECSNTIETEKEIQDAKINESLQLETNSNVINEFEILKSSVIYPNQNKGYKELDVHKCGLKVDYFENNIGCLTDLMPQDLSNDPVTIPSVLNQNMLGLDYQNRDYFSPDKIRNMMNNLGNGRIECTICSVTTTRRAFYKHAKKHFNIKPFQCGYCNYRSIEKSKIRVHNSFCHPGSQCIIIKLSPNTASMDVALSNLESTEYSDAIDFSKNVSSHSNDKKKKLNVRGKLSTKLRVKETESLSASGWFRCPVCQKELRYHLPTLRRHLYTHFNYKPFKCGLCPFTASDGGEVRGHHITHRSTDEAKVEISGAVMHPDLAKLLVDSFGYSQLNHHEIDFPSKKKIKRKNASVSNVTMGNLEQEEILSSAGSKDNICSDSTNYKERDLNEFHLSPDCICENGDVKHVRVTGVI